MSAPKKNAPQDWRHLITPKQALLAVAFFLFFTWLVGWKFALILMGSLLFHEFGHAAGIRHYGLRIQGFYFLPPFGLAVASADPWPTRKAESVIALLGPAWGLTLGLATYGLALLTGNPILAGVAAFMAVLNGFNLVPINPLDGGRVAKSIAYSISPKLGFAWLGIGLAGAAVLGYFLNPVVFVLIIFMGWAEFKNELVQHRRQADRRRMLELLSRRFKTEPETGAVLRAMDLHFRFLVLSGDEDLVFERIHEIERDVAALRGVHSQLLGGQRYYVTPDESLRLVPWGPEGVANSPLGKFLIETGLPPLTKRQLVGVLACHIGMIIVAVALFAAASSVMPMMKAMELLK